MGRCPQSYLHGFVEPGTEVSEDLEAFIQFHCFFVFTEKIDEGVRLALQLPVPEFQLRQLFHSKLEEKQTGTMRETGSAGVDVLSGEVRFQVSAKGRLRRPLRAKRKMSLPKADLERTR